MQSCHRHVDYQHSFSPLVIVDSFIMKKYFDYDADQIGHVRDTFITGCYTRVQYFAGYFFFKTMPGKESINCQ